MPDRTINDTLENAEGPLANYANSLGGTTVALPATNGFEDSELMRPLEALHDAGAEVEVISESLENIKGKNGLGVAVDKTVEDALAEDYDGLFLPGGMSNPDTLRLNTAAVAFVKQFFTQKKPVAAICHAPWLLVEADVLEGRTLTSWPSPKTDIINAGGDWLDEEVVVDQGLVTSRKPDDIPAFTTKMIEEFKEGIHPSVT